MMKTLTQNQRPKVIMFVICAVALLGTIIIGGSLASNTSPFDVQIDGVHSYAADPITQLQRISVSVNIVNDSTSVLQISPGLQMQLIDSTGLSHPMTAAYLPAGEIVGGPLAPGASWTQSIDFNLPAGQTPAKFIFQPDGQSNPTEIGL